MELKVEVSVQCPDFGKDLVDKDIVRMARHTEY